MESSEDPLLGVLRFFSIYFPDGKQKDPYKGSLDTIQGSFIITTKDPYRYYTKVPYRYYMKGVI